MRSRREARQFWPRATPESANGEAARPSPPCAGSVAAHAQRAPQSQQSVLGTPCQPVVGRSRRHRPVAVGGLRLVGGGVARQLGRARHPHQLPPGSSLRASTRSASVWATPGASCSTSAAARRSSPAGPATCASRPSKECGRRRCSRPRPPIRSAPPPTSPPCTQLGFNSVRVFIDLCVPQQTCIGNPEGGLNAAYMDNVATFLRLAAENELQVMLASAQHAPPATPAGSRAASRSAASATRCTSPRGARRSPPSTGATSSPRCASGRRRWTRSSPTSWPRSSTSPRTRRRCRGARGR